MSKSNPEQTSLFGSTEIKVNDEFLSRQLIKLGDMMGDGLHHEEPWIAKEYKKIAKILYPDMYDQQRKARVSYIDKAMTEVLKKNKCTCGGPLVQVRKGSYKSKCYMCGARYTCTKKK